MNHRLSNGLAVVHLHIPRSLVSHFGVAVRAGSADEGLDPRVHGLAHFVEHTIFKGTERRRSWHIINRMEAVGGELNAFTGKEDTVIYTTFPRNATLRAVELVTDLILNASFPEKEIDKERHVICDEINSYLDSPSDAVLDSFEDLLYAGTPLGHNILGSVESVSDISREMCLDWIKRHYTADRMVAFYAGAMTPESFIKKAAPLLSQIPPKSIDTLQVPYSTQTQSFDITQTHPIHQANTAMGCSLRHENTGDNTEHLTLALLTNILGGPGMNSMLNVAMRERRGLVYNVEATATRWSGNLGSMFNIYYGTDPEDDGQCREIVRRHINDMAHSPMNQRALAAAKKQYRGQTILARQNTENRIISLARATLHGHSILSLEDLDMQLGQITPERLRSMAEKLTDLSVLTLMPR